MVIYVESVRAVCDVVQCKLCLRLEGGHKSQLQSLRCYLTFSAPTNSSTEKSDLSCLTILSLKCIFKQSAVPFCVAFFRYDITERMYLLIIDGFLQSSSQKVCPNCQECVHNCPHPLDAHQLLSHDNIVMVGSFLFFFWITLLTWWRLGYNVHGRALVKHWTLWGMNHLI